MLKLIDSSFIPPAACSTSYTNDRFSNVKGYRQPARLYHWLVVCFVYQLAIRLTPRSKEIVAIFPPLIKFSGSNLPSTRRKLHLPKPLVEALLRDKPIMIATLDDLTIFNHQNLIDTPDCRQLMGDHNHRSAPE